MHALKSNHDKAIAIAQEEAKKWHSTQEGKKFHSELSKKNWEKRKECTYTCSWCGKTFQTKHQYGESQNRFCHANCKAAALRKRKKDERENHGDKTGGKS